MDFLLNWLCILFAKMLSFAEVQKLSRLAQLEFDDQKSQQFQSELSEILEYVVQLSEVDTQGVLPTYQVTGLENVLRADEVQKCSSREEILACSELPQKDNMIEVPAVFK